MRLALVLACCTSVALAANAQDPLPTRQVAAPPQDVLSRRVRLPDPAASAIVSESAWIAIELAPAPDGTHAWEGEVPVAADGPLAIAWIGVDALAWRVSLGAEGVAAQPLETWLARPGVTYRAGDERGWQAQRLELAAAPAGAWRVRVEAEQPARGWIAVRDASGVRITSHASTFATIEGADVAMLASLAPLRGERARSALVEHAELVIDAGGVEIVEPMLDDGLHADGAAGDGVLGAFVPPGLAGDMRARVVVRGLTESGLRFERAAHHRVRVLPRTIELDGAARAAGIDALERTELRLGVELAAAPRVVHVSAEVWGKDERGGDVPVCWLARLAAPEPGPDGWELPLALDARWVALAGAQAPFELREARIQDRDHHVVLDRRARIPLGTIPLAAVDRPAAPTWSMLAGPAVAPLGGQPPVVSRSTARALLLTHGYCSSGGVWPAADFTPPKRDFLDPDADRTNDEFAQVMLAQTNDLGSFGVVAHSQGGLAALQLFAYYTSGLDYATGARRIQSVASPYQGTPLADFSSFACGDHNDLAPGEAVQWLATIPTWARAEVYYWTVANNGSACDFFTDFLLANPEDGVVERARGELPGGNAMGHASGWCHTTGMSNPACYADHARNQLMDVNAAR